MFPGEAESGFEVLESVHGTVNDREIYVTINGVVASGCYKEWNSAIYHTSIGPSDTVVRALFYQWDAPGFGGLIVDTYVPEEPDDPIIAQISGLRMFYVGDEYEVGVRYRHRFIKTD